MGVAQIITYLGLAIGVIAMLIKIFRYMSAPEHMRWELYPVPHEKGRAAYGGSYLEELDWWTKKRRTDLFNELKEMFEEIILLKGVYHNNKKVWFFSFPFHFGMYIGIGWICLLIIGAIMQLAGTAVEPGSGTFALIIFYATIITGYAAMILTGFGAAGLFFWRIGDAKQRPYNAPIEYFNLLLFVAVIAVALISHITGDISFNIMRGYTRALLTFKGAATMPWWFTAEIIMGALLFMYIPLTRMSHFVAKYFLYHSVRWNDEPNERGSKIEKRIIQLLGEKVEWKSAHIQTGKTWGEVIKETPHE